MKNVFSLSKITWLQSFAAVMVLATQPAFAHHPIEHRHDHSAKDTSTVEFDLNQIREMVSTFQTTGEDHHLEEAWDALEPALKRSSQEPDLLITAAFVAQSRHEFSRAHAFLDQALGQNPRDSQAWLLKASLHLVKAESEQAAKACRQLQRVSLLVILSCHSRVALVEGDTRRAYTALHHVLMQGHTDQAPTDILAWSFSIAGDLAVATDQLAQARAHYQKSLGLNERSQVRAALVDVQLSQGEYENAWQTVNAAHLALPLLVRKFVAARHTGRLSMVQEQIDQSRKAFERWIAANDWQHAREMARFYLDVDENIMLATKLATINAELQREPEDLKLLARIAGH